MDYILTNLGFDTADGEDVQLTLRRGDLCLTFTDWREQSVSVTFREILGFKWDYEQDDVVSIRDDTTYEVVGSPWLELQRRLQAIEDLTAYAHYKLCFNAAGVLDVLCRRMPRCEPESLTDRERLG